MLAQCSGSAFETCSDLCLTSLKKGVEYGIPSRIQGKKDKLSMYQHARDNAIASIGKVIKYQTALVQSNPNYQSNLVTYWLNLLPITYDVEEAIG